MDVNKRPYVSQWKHPTGACGLASFETRAVETFYRPVPCPPTGLRARGYVVRAVEAHRGGSRHNRRNRFFAVRFSTLTLLSQTVVRN
jgi:hypothetical protein